MNYGTITIYSHYFTVDTRNPRFSNALRAYQSEFLVEKTLVRTRGRFTMKPTTFWWRRSLRSNERALIITEYDSFMNFLYFNGIEIDRIKIVHAPVHEGVKFDIKVEGYIPWEEQIPILDFVKGDSYKYIITSQPGSGKTLMALFLAEHIGERFVVITKGGFEGRWVPTLYETLGLAVDEVRSCCGEKALRRLIEEKKKTGIPEVKAIFFSISGIRTYINNYEAGAYVGTSLEDVPPEKLFEFLGIGFKIVDEAHMEIHAHYITDLYTNIKHSLYLTGTLIPKENDHFTAKVYETFLPPRLRKEASKLRVYAEAVEVFYELNEPNEAKYIGAQGGYNHIVLEEWILKNKARKDNWLQMLYDHLVEEWLTERVEETKAIIYCASVDMNEEVAKYMQRRLPDLKVVHFKAGDPYDYLIDNDLILATLGKAGTAVDIPMLEQVHMCHATDSPNTYIQAFGRLRELKKFPQIVVRYFWFTCKNIQKQVDYGLRRAKIIKPRVTKLKNKFLRKRI